MRDEQLSLEELGQIDGGAKYGLSVQAAAGRSSLAGGASEGLGAGDRKSYEPEVLDNGLIAIAGG